MLPCILQQVVLGRLAALLAAPLQGVQAGAAPEEPRFAESVAVRARIALLQVPAAGTPSHTLSVRLALANKLCRRCCHGRLQFNHRLSARTCCMHFPTVAAVALQAHAVCAVYANCCDDEASRGAIRKAQQPMERCVLLVPQPSQAALSISMTSCIAGLNPQRRPSHCTLQPSGQFAQL